MQLIIHTVPRTYIGGGERRGKGIVPQSRTGVLAKGGKTRKKSKPMWYLIKDRPRGYDVRGGKK